MLRDVLVDLFEDFHYTWKQDGKDIVPNSTDIQQVLDQAAGVLKEEPLNTQLQVGRLIIVKSTQSKYDVYIMAGSYT